MAELHELEIVDFSDLMKKIEGAKSSVFRFECLQSYDVDYEEEVFRKFKEGIPIPDNFMKSWIEFFRPIIERGVRFCRVRLIERPLTLYLKYEIEAYKQSAAHGEEIRILEAKNDDLGRNMKPIYTDFWEVDGIFYYQFYDVVGRFVGVAQISEVDWAAYENYKCNALENSRVIQETDLF